MADEFIYCSKCGTRNFADDVKCGACDAKLLKSKPRAKKPRATTAQTTTAKTKEAPTSITGGCSLLVIVAVIITGIVYYFDTNDISGKETVFNNPVDSSVAQVVDFIRHGARDSADYIPVAWGKVRKVSSSNRTGVDRYTVNHSYRTKDAFGKYQDFTQTFVLDYDGSIVFLRDISEEQFRADLRSY